MDELFDCSSSSIVDDSASKSSTKSSSSSSSLLKLWLWWCLILLEVDEFDFDLWNLFLWDVIFDVSRFVFDVVEAVSNVLSWFVVLVSFVIDDLEDVDEFDELDLPFYNKNWKFFKNQNVLNVKKINNLP